VTQADPTPNDSDRWLAAEHTRAQRHPISRWIVMPLVLRVVPSWIDDRITPTAVSLFGLFATLIGCIALTINIAFAPIAAGCVFIAWFADRTDGPLARWQKTDSPWGRWLDANLDELGDVLWHGAIVLALAPIATAWPWLVAFLAGKYLLFVGLQHPSPDDNTTATNEDAKDRPQGNLVHTLVRNIYHGIGNADVRYHLLLVSLLVATWWPLALLVELVIVAVYYNMRWVVRYGLMYRRLNQPEPEIISLPQARLFRPDTENRRAA
jgi:MFS family permease